MVLLFEEQLVLLFIAFLVGAWFASRVLLGISSVTVAALVAIALVIVVPNILVFPAPLMPVMGADLITLAALALFALLVAQAAYGIPWGSAIALLVLAWFVGSFVISAIRF